MKYSDKVCVGALIALAKLRKSVPKLEARTIGFVAEAVAEKRARDHPRTKGDLIRIMDNDELAMFLAKTRADVCRADLLVVSYHTADVDSNLEWLGLELDGDKEKFHGPY
ncbi:MAG: hypothetical protein RR235_09480 [Oscillospiraceae bacterium]